ncbi:MAG: serine--tRNA ligase [bacterium]|nr:serine--tRNA ligase [bacterium]
MLDIQYIREHADLVKAGVEKKKVDPKLVDKFLRADEMWKAKVAAIDELRREQNVISKELAGGQKDDLVSKATLLKTRIGQLEKEVADLAAKRTGFLNRLPNVPAPDVPVGPDESANRVLREVGERPVFDFPVKDYLSIGERLGLIDVKRAAKVSGSRFGYLLREGALLEFALERLALDTLLPHGFVPVIPPVMVRPEMLEGMGRLAADQKEERYFLEKDGLYLVGSAEHSMGPFHAGETLDENRLPKRYVGFSTSFRREAGSYGKDTKGILRVHQFDKVELFSFCHPEKSEEEHRFLLSLQEELVAALELPYRVVEMCTGDMGWTDFRQFDVDIWFPAEGCYRETHSCSNTTDFQSRGINAKFTAGGEKGYLHLLNATAFSQRPILAILENYQTKRGTVRVPKALQKYVGKKEIVGENQKSDLKNQS